MIMICQSISKQDVMPMRLSPILFQKIIHSKRRRITPMAIKVHVILWRYVVQTWMYYNRGLV